MTPLAYTHVDVFSTRAFGGNSLPVFIEGAGLSAAQMLAITREMRHFEAIFLERTEVTSRVRARVFDLFEELPFAGHPIIGAAAVLHSLAGRDQATLDWAIELPERTVSINTTVTESGFFGMLDQGAPEFLGVVSNLQPFAEAFSLGMEDLHAGLQAQVVSTGLRYLVLPVQPGVLEKARVRVDLTRLLGDVGAQFAVLFDEAALEIRHWNNDGVIEDVATGSAAGCIGAYRLRHRLAEANETFLLHQGRFLGRASQLHVQAEGSAMHIRSIKVGGNVVIVGRGEIFGDA